MERLILDWRSENLGDRILARTAANKAARARDEATAEIRFFHPSTEDRDRGLCGFFRPGENIIFLNCRLGREAARAHDTT